MNISINGSLVVLFESK